MIPPCFLCELLAEPAERRTMWCAAFALGIEMAIHSGKIEPLCQTCTGALRRAVEDICTDVETTRVIGGDAPVTTKERGVA